MLINIDSYKVHIYIFKVNIEPYKIKLDPQLQTLNKSTNP